MSPSPPVSALCLNCGQNVAGKFCANCGQENRPPVVPLGEFIGDVSGEFVSWDAKIIRSLVPLLFRPGFLTNEYIAGKRVSYLFPSRLFIIINFVFFLLAQQFDPLTAKSLADPKPFTPTALSEKFDNEVANILPSFLLAIIPLFAGMLKLVYILTERYYTEHLVFAFHFFAFVLVAYTPLLFVKNETAINVWLLGVPFVYLACALRTVYRESLGLTALKTLLLWMGYVTLLIVYAIFVLSIASMRSGFPWLNLVS